MKNRFPAITAWGFLLVALVFAAAPARSDVVDQRIQALEEELTKHLGRVEV